MKVLIPTDFSKLSRVAIQFAVKMAKKLNGEIILLNVIYLSAPPHAMVEVKIKAIMDAMVENAKQESLLLIEELRKENKGRLNLRYEIIKGYPVQEVITSYATNNGIDIIIMGTKGATGLKKVLIGSNAVSVINHSDIPIITVPEFARFNGLKNIIYATDMWDLNIEAKILVPLARLFNSTIHVVHIISPNSKNYLEIKKVTADLITELNYAKVKFKVVINENVLNGVDEYIADSKADLLAMFTRELTFFDKLFGKSITRKMAFHTWIPMLTFKKKWQ